MKTYGEYDDFTEIVDSIWLAADKDNSEMEDYVREKNLDVMTNAAYHVEGPFEVKGGE